MTWLILALVFAVLWAFWVWLGLLLDKISELNARRSNFDDAQRTQIRRDLRDQKQRDTAWRERRREAVSANKERDRSF